MTEGLRALSEAVGILAQVQLAVSREFVVPFLAEPFGQRPFEELVEAYPFLPAEFPGRFADFPAVVVDGGEGREFLQAQRVEGAGRGLAEAAVGAPLAVGFFNGAERSEERRVGKECRL